MKKTTIFLALLTALMLTTVGCGSGSGTSQSDESEYSEEASASGEESDSYGWPDEEEETSAAEEQSTADAESEESTDDDVDLSLTQRSRSEERQLLREVARKITNAADQYLKTATGKSASRYNWTFTLEKSDEINAYCTPDGNVVVYTGLMPLCSNADQLAAVVGHEVAHVIMEHAYKSNEKAVLASIGAIAVDLIGGSTAANVAYNVGVNYGVLLPAERKQESEADVIGLILSTVAGYDPNEAVPFWKKMQAQSQVHVPALLSDHPSDKKRIETIERVIPEIEANYGNGMPDKIVPISTKKKNATYQKVKAKAKEKYHEYKDKLKSKLSNWLN